MLALLSLAPFSPADASPDLAPVEARSSMYAGLMRPAWDPSDLFVEVTASRVRGRTARICVLAIRSTAPGEPGVSVGEVGCADAESYILDPVLWQGAFTATVPTTARFYDGSAWSCQVFGDQCTVLEERTGLSTIDMRMVGDRVPFPRLPAYPVTGCYMWPPICPGPWISPAAPAPLGVSRPARAWGSVTVGALGEAFEIPDAAGETADAGMIFDVI